MGVATISEAGDGGGGGRRRGLPGGSRRRPSTALYETVPKAPASPPGNPSLSTSTDSSPSVDGTRERRLAAT